MKKKIKRSFDPDYLFLEPSEMIVTKELQDVLKMGLRDIRYEIGPFITLIDGPTFSFQWQERPKLIQGQLQNADIVVLSRIDRIDSIGVEYICSMLNLSKKKFLLLDQKNDSGMAELAQQILSTNQEKQSLAK